MSEDILAPLITIGIFAGLFLWVPTLHVCNDHCRRLFLREPRNQTVTNDAQDERAA